MAGNKEAVAIVLDIGSSMAHGGDEGHGSLDTALQAVNMLIQRKIFAKSKDEIALILFGTHETVNNLHEDSGGYEHITVVRELGPADLELLSLVNKSIQMGSNAGDFVDALVVAMDHLIKKTSGRKFELRIILLTNLDGPFGTDQIDTIAQSMKDHGIQLTFVGPDLDGDEEEEDDQDGDRGNDEHGDGRGGKRQRLQNPSPKPLTPQQIQGVNCVNYILGEVNGDGISLSEVMPMLSFFQLRSVKQTTVFRGPLEISPSLKINVYGYCKVKEAKMASWKKLSAVAEASANPLTMGISQQRSHHLQDEDQTEVEAEEIVKAYKYGKSLVPVARVDQEVLKLETDKCLTILGFTDLTNINRGHLLGDGVYIFSAQPGDKDAARALSAVTHALAEKNMVAIVRYCFRKNAAPKLGALIPNIKSQYESLVFVQLPFREDVRHYQFPSLFGDGRPKPAETQLQSMDQLIDAMDLTASHITPFGDQTEEFKPSQTVNPWIQRQCQCIQHRALNPDVEKLPPVEDYIERLLQCSSERREHLQNITSKLKDIFPVQEQETADGTKKTAANFFKVSDVEKEGDEGVPSVSGQTNFSFTAVDGKCITEVGTADPVHDFTVLVTLQPERFRDVAVELQRCIFQLITHSFLDQNYPKAVNCLKALRSQCLERRSSVVFNEVLSELRSTLAGGRRADFLEKLKQEHLLPISRAESPESTLSPERAGQFFEEFGESKKEESPDVPVEEADDLLDLL